MDGNSGFTSYWSLVEAYKNRHFKDNSRLYQKKVKWTDSPSVVIHITKDYTLYADHLITIIILILG